MNDEMEKKTMKKTKKETKTTREKETKKRNRNRNRTHHLSIPFSADHTYTLIPHSQKTEPKKKQTNSKHSHPESAPDSSLGIHQPTTEWQHQDASTIPPITLEGVDCLVNRDEFGVVRRVI